MSTQQIIDGWEHGIEPYDLNARPEYAPQESVADFRNRIRNLMRGRSPDAINGASHANPCVVRK